MKKQKVQDDKSSAENDAEHKDVKRQNEVRCRTVLIYNICEFIAFGKKGIKLYPQELLSSKLSL